jgi:hypothetical protein
MKGAQREAFSTALRVSCPPGLPPFLDRFCSLTLFPFILSFTTYESAAAQLSCRVIRLRQENGYGKFAGRYQEVDPILISRPTS